MAFDATAVQERLAEKSVTANYSTFFVGGVVLAVAGAGLFGLSLVGTGSHRAWHAFHVNWVFWTGVTCGSLAITSVHKIVGAKWSGVILRLSQATAFFIPVSIVGLILILTAG